MVIQQERVIPTTVTDGLNVHEEVTLEDTRVQAIETAPTTLAEVETHIVYYFRSFLKHAPFGLQERGGAVIDKALALAKKKSGLRANLYSEYVVAEAALVASRADQEGRPQNESWNQQALSVIEDMLGVNSEQAVSFFNRLQRLATAISAQGSSTEDGMEADF